MLNELSIGKAVECGPLLCRIVDIERKVIHWGDGSVEEVYGLVEIATPRCGNGDIKVSPTDLNEISDKNFIILIEIEFRAKLQNIWYMKLDSDYNSKLL